MSAPSPRVARWLTVLGIAAIVLAAGGLLLSQWALPRAGARWLSHWQEAGLPGRAPRGSGPTFHLGVPPTLSWSDVQWMASDSLSVECRKLDIAVRPLRLVRGGVQITAISAEGLRIEADPVTEPWCRAILEGLADTLEPAKPLPADRNSMRFKLLDVGFRRGNYRVDRIVGRAWAPRRAAWECEARIVLTDGRGVDFGARGTGRVGAAEVQADFSSDSRHRLDLAARRPVGGPWTWRASARDDGRLLLALPPLDPYRSSLAFEGEVDVWVERGERAGLDGEAHVRDGRLSIGVGPAWTVDGTVCVGGDTLSFEDFSLERDSTRITGSLAMPITRTEGTGWCALAGSVDGRPFRVRGALRRAADRWTIFAPSVRFGDEDVGPLEFTANLAAPKTEGRFRGELLIDEGALSLLGGTGRVESPFRIRLAKVSIERILPLFRVSLPGTWAGPMATEALVWKSPYGWRATGGSVLSGGRVADLPLLEDVSSLVGSRSRSSLRIDHARARWLWDSGKIWADSLTIDAKELTIAGSLGYASEDSILGLFRVVARGDGQVGRLLRLIGGKGSLDLGIAGDPSRPTLLPLDATTRRAWLSRMSAARPRWAPASEAIDLRRP